MQCYGVVESYTAKTNNISKMASTKAALKAAKSALDSQNWAEAVTQAKIVTAADPKNYFGYDLLIAVREHC